MTNLSVCTMKALETGKPKKEEDEATFSRVPSFLVTLAAYSTLFWSDSLTYQGETYLIITSDFTTIYLMFD